MTGTSARENLADIRKHFEDGHRGRIVVDVGAGQGTYGEALRGLGLRMEAVECWEPSVNILQASPDYAYVTTGDIREVGNQKLYQGTDAVIFGDVLEHLSIHDAHVVFHEAYKWSRQVIVSVPNSPYPQGPLDGNAAEEHLILDPVSELIAYLPPYDERWDYPVTSTFVWNTTRK